MTRFKISRTLLYWYAPVSYLGALLAHSYQSELLNYSSKIHFLAALTTLSSILFLWIALGITKSRVRWLALQEPTSSYVSILAIVLVGPIRGLVMDRLSVLLEIDSGLTLSNRMIVSTASTTFWLLMLSYFINVNSLYRQKYRSLISQALVLGSKDQIDENLRFTLDNVEESLRAIKVESIGPTDQAEVLRRMSIALKNQVEEIIRPLSRRLWLSAIDEYPKLRLRNTLVDAVKKLGYSLPLLSSLVSFITLSTMPTFMPFREALTRTIIIVVALNLVTRAFRFFRSLPIGTSILFSTVEVLSLSYLPIAIGDMVFSKGYFVISTPVSLLVYLIIPFIVISLAMVNQVRTDRSHLISMMAQRFQKPLVAGFQAQHVASYLHNSLQSELLALAQRLERASHEPEVDRNRLILEDLQVLINRSVSEDFLNSYGEPQERLRQVIRNWAGIIDITVENVELMFQKESKTVTAVQLIEELASNLSKHSNQDTLNVVCVSHSGRLYIQVNHGHLPAVERNSGMGSLLLAHLKYDTTPKDNFLDQGKLTYLIQ